MFYQTPDNHSMVVEYTASGNSFTAGKLDDLPPETLQFMLEEAEAKAALEREQCAAPEGGDAQAPPNVK